MSPSASDRPAIVIIPGGWHTPASYNKLTTALSRAGHEVHVPALPSMNGARPPTADLRTDTAFVRDFVSGLIDAGRSVVVIMHSYSGQVGTNALVGLGLKTRAERGLPGCVAQLIYLCAFALPEGWSMVGLVSEMGHEELLPLAFDFADDGTVLSRDPKMLLVGPGIDDEELEAYVSSLQRWNGTCMYQMVEHCAWRQIPVLYVYATKDMTVPIEYQKKMVEGMREYGVQVLTEELETGHCPNATMTAEVVRIVDGVVKKLAGG